jgi:DNA replication protein DnaC
MSEPSLKDTATPARKEPCGRCGGEGVVFTVEAGRAVASACACTRDCPECAGSGRLYEQDARGYSVLKGCGCGADPRRLQLLTGLRLPLQFIDKEFSRFEPRSASQMKALGRASRFVDEFVPRANGMRALLFSGRPGTGKTHLLSAILRTLALRKGVRGRYEEFFLLLSDIKDGFSRGIGAREWLEPLRSVEVLAIDEIGKGGKNREFEQGVLDEIISVRYNAGRPTLLATNYPRSGAAWKFAVEGEVPETLEQRVGARIYSRLHELCDFIDIEGPDYRREQHDARERTPSGAAGGTRSSGARRG